MPTLSSGLVVIPSLTQRNVTIDLKFTPSVGISARKFDKLKLDIRSFKEPLTRSIREVMIPSIRQNFDSGGRPPWEALAHSTVVTKKGDTRPLIRTGELRRQMGYIKIWHIDTEKAFIADLPAKVWYGKVHQAGHGATTRTVTMKNIATGQMETFTESDDEGGSGAIPARPFVVLQRDDAIKIDRQFEEWIGERIARAGLGR
jgi:phage gpG-like protein